MKYIAVKHQPEQDIAYWFEVPQDLADVVKVGKEVLCDTRRGDMTGTIVSIMDGISEEVAAKIVGYRFPLKKIIAVSMDFELSNIYIPWEMENSYPEPETIAQRVSEFYDTGSFKTAVLCSSDGNLKDGYSAYLVAKMFGHETLRGFCVSLQ